MIKILATDSLDPKGIEVLNKEEGIEVIVKPKPSPEELRHILKDCQGVIVRSETKLTEGIINSAPDLKVIGRAGVGVDNICLDAATRRGIIVMNTPQGNTTSTAEHTITLILALSRNISKADLSIRQGRWEKNKFVGIEISGKVLGVIGLGQVGGEVAKLARGLGMDVIGYDPYISSDKAKRLGVKMAELDIISQKADYITVHTPLTKETRHLINKDFLSRVKPGVRIINCARGGIVDETALYEALKDGKVAGAALDVYEKEPVTKSPLFELDNCLFTPHLGASTREAQTGVAVTVARQIIDFLKKGIIRNAVNFMSLPQDLEIKLRPYCQLNEKLGQLLTGLLQSHLSQVEVRYNGELTSFDTKPLTTGLLVGLLRPVMGETVNYINAHLLAKERGIEIIETKTNYLEDFANLITVVGKGSKEEWSLCGTIFGQDDPRIVRINGFHVDAVPKGSMLILVNDDRPGVIGDVGGLLGEKGVNIAGMTCGRKEKGKRAITVLNIDEPLSPDILNQVRSLPKIISCQVVSL